MAQTSATAARKLLTVCLGNHCRSPLATAVLAHRGGDTIEVRSAGLHPVRHVGLPAHPLMVHAAQKREYDLTCHRGVALTPDLLTWADLVLAMDHAVLEELQRRASAADRPKIELYLAAGDVPDPWGQDAKAFEDCADLIEHGAGRHLAQAGHNPAKPTPASG